MFPSRTISASRRLVIILTKANSNPLIKAYDSTHRLFFFVGYNDLMIRRNYITKADVAGSSEAHVGLAEELIDQYVGPQPKYLQNAVVGKVSAASGNKIFDTNDGSVLGVSDNTFSYCVMEIIGGTGLGATRRITASSESEKSVTLVDDFDEVDTTSVFRIYQLSKFPRRQDMNTAPGSTTIYKFIPEAIRAATKAQVEFILEKGDDYFNGDDVDVQSESIGNYSYSKGNSAEGQSAMVKLIAPKARTLLRGYKNSRGQLIPENPTCL